MLKRYRLADLAHTVPMPDRGGRLFGRSVEGETVDTEQPFYSRLILDGDLIEVSSEQPAAEQRGKSKGK